MTQQLKPRDVQPTAEQLRRALVYIARSTRRCPGTLESCLADNTWRTCLHAMAKRLALRDLQQREPEPRVPAAPAVRPLPRLTFDARKAAAGDQEEDRDAD